MIIEQRRFLRWVTFPTATHIRPSLRAVYLQCTVDTVAPWTHHRQPFQSYCMNLQIPAAERFAGYTAKLRQNVRRASKVELTIHRDQQYEHLLDLFQLTIKAKLLPPVTAGHFSTKSDFLISTIQHPEYGPLAAHAYVLDRSDQTVKLEYNASAYRRFEHQSSVRNLCGLANCKLFDDDFTYFGQQGFTTYDFGGYGSGAGVQSFKDQFGGEVVKQVNYLPIWYALYRKMRGL